MAKLTVRVGQLLCIMGERRCEEILCKRLSLVGLCIAIGAPGDNLPPLGAARGYFADDEWQAEF